MAEASAWRTRVTDLGWDIAKAAVQGSVFYLLATPTGIIKRSPTAIAVAVVILVAVAAGALSSVIGEHFERNDIPIRGFALVVTIGPSILLGGAMALYILLVIRPDTDVLALLTGAAVLVSFGGSRLVLPWWRRQMERMKHEATQARSGPDDGT